MTECWKYHDTNTVAGEEHVNNNKNQLNQDWLIGFTCMCMFGDTFSMVF